LFSLGIKEFKRQLTKEEKNIQNGISLEDYTEKDENENEFLKIKDDLESTKQLLELEIRSKNLLERDNKRLLGEIEKLKAEMMKLNTDDCEETVSTQQRKGSIQEKKKSIIRLTSESGQKNLENGDFVEEQETEIFELKEEADEARRLAEEWEAKYKEMQRHMEELEISHNSTIDSEKSADVSKVIDDCGEKEDWVTKREMNNLKIKLRHTKEKKEVIKRERKLLNERLQNLRDNISQEIDLRIQLKKEVKEMNTAFIEEMQEMETKEKSLNDLEDVYYSDEEDLVVNQNPPKITEDFANLETEETEELTIDEILKSAEDMFLEENDEGFKFFEEQNECDDIGEEDQDFLSKSLINENEKIQLMRKSNFLLKSKIDILSDSLQLQKEKHHELKQELNRMLLDVQ